MERAFKYYVCHDVLKYTQCAGAICFFLLGPLIWFPFFYCVDSIFLPQNAYRKSVWHKEKGWENLQHEIPFFCMSNKCRFENDRQNEWLNQITQAWKQQTNTKKNHIKQRKSNKNVIKNSTDANDGW